MKAIVWFVLVFVLFAAGGCYAVKLELVDASVQKPSNVALYFSMDNKDGNPVPGIEASQFKIYEDEQLISEHESQQTILNPEVVIERYTMLLLDMSGSVVESGQIPVLQEAVAVFLENIGDNEKVAIYAFDGREDIQEIAGFGTREATLARRNELLSNYQPEDPSTNLNGAIIKAVEVIDKQQNKSDAPLKFGNVVVFTDGTDRAHRATTDEALEALKPKNMSSFVIGLGGNESDAEMLKEYGTEGYVQAQDHDTLATSFEDVANKINAQSLRYYVLSYCSPSRAGTHNLRLEVEVGEDKGKLEYEFDAEGFEPKCDPNDMPKFEIPDDNEDEDKLKSADDERRGKKKTKKQKNKRSGKKVKKKDGGGKGAGNGAAKGASHTNASVNVTPDAPPAP